MPYKCNICDKSFRYKVSQRSHKCTGPQSPAQSEGNSSDLVIKSAETGTEIYSGTNYSIKLMHPSITTVPNENDNISSNNPPNTDELIINVNVIGNNTSN